MVLVLLYLCLAEYKIIVIAFFFFFLQNEVTTSIMLTN